MTVVMTTASALARVLKKDARTIARWCAEGDIECSVRGTGSARRYDIIVRDNVVVVCGMKVTLE